MNDALSRLRGLVHVSTAPDVRAHYARDASRALPEGLPSAVAFPASTTEVAAVLTWACELGLIVSVRGAGTGLSGGAVATTAGSCSPPSGFATSKSMWRT